MGDSIRSEEEFIQLLTEKYHLKDSECSLVMCANIRSNTTTFRLYNTLKQDSLKFQSTITNSEDLEKQLYHLWLQLNSLMRRHRPPYPTE